MSWYKEIFFGIGFLFLSLHAAAQQAAIKGIVVDSTTSKPIANVSILLASTTIGTITSDQGGYALTGLSPGRYIIILSSLGYGIKQSDIKITAGEQVLNFSLEQKPIILNEVKVPDRGNRQKNLILFKRDFIGTTNEMLCKITNPSILDLQFNGKYNRLMAKTSEFLDIENYFLGYRLRFLIKDFWADYNEQKYHYNGTVVFAELPGTADQKKIWDQARLSTYKGSFNHFMSAAFKQELSKNNFLVKKLMRKPNAQRPPDSLIKHKLVYFTARKKENPGDGKLNDSISSWIHLFALPKTIEKLATREVKEDDLIKHIAGSSNCKLVFSGSLYVIYKGNKNFVDDNNLRRFKEARNFQISAITNKTTSTEIVVDNRGRTDPKESLFFEGAWTQRIVKLLPTDYTPNNLN